MRIIKLIAAGTGVGLAALLLQAAPALAASNCYAMGKSGISTGFEFHFGSPFSEDDITDFAVMQLRSRGIDAVSAEIWGGCIRAYVRKPGGGTRMEFFNKETLEPVDF